MVPRFLPTPMCRRPSLQTLIITTQSKCLEIIMVYFGCLLSHGQWHDESSLHQYCMDNSPDMFCVFVVSTDCLQNKLPYFPCFFLSKEKKYQNNSICDIKKKRIIGGNVNKFNAVLQKIHRMKYNR